MCARWRLRHERAGDGQEEQRNHRDQARDGSTESAATGEETRKEGQNFKEEGNEEEDPAKSPEVEVLGRGGVSAMAADEIAGSVGCIASPSLTEGGCCMSIAAVHVALATEVEEGPLCNVAGAGDSVRVGT